MPRNKPQFVYCLADAVTHHGGARVRMSRGEVWDATDPFVKAHPEFFDESPPDVRRTVAPVETATAAPGEKRA